MEITIKCECGNECIVKLKTTEEIQQLENTDELYEIDNDTEQFKINKHSDCCITMGSFKCKCCGKYGNL